MKRGTRKTNILRTDWSPELAYAIGLIVTDGNVSPDMRHVSFTSKDLELVLLYRRALGITNAIGRKGRGADRTRKKYYVVQFGSVQFIEFLLQIGVMPAKSKTVGKVHVPDQYFFDFLRGCFDGDGNYNEFVHSESRHAQLRIRLYSASEKFLVWVQGEVARCVPKCGGWIRKEPGSSVYVLSYGKRGAVAILKRMYTRTTRFSLSRKYGIAKKYL